MPKYYLFTFRFLENHCRFAVLTRSIRAFMTTTSTKDFSFFTRASVAIALSHAPWQLHLKNTHPKVIRMQRLVERILTAVVADSEHHFPIRIDVISVNFTITKVPTSPLARPCNRFLIICSPRFCRAWLAVRRAAPRFEVSLFDEIFPWPIPCLQVRLFCFL